ncbi:MAG: hypothetical protein QM445_02030 [Thermotogota bacterium]|jgi:hypothetical protein|nr:hypothetical protein [Thermotogota bacterium]
MTESIRSRPLDFLARVEEVTVRKSTTSILLWRSAEVDRFSGFICPVLMKKYATQRSQVNVQTRTRMPFYTPDLAQIISLAATNISIREEGSRNHQSLLYNELKKR